jgi:hypothetical protein
MTCTCVPSLSAGTQVSSAAPKTPTAAGVDWSLVGYGNPFGKPWKGPLVGETWWIFSFLSGDQTWEILFKWVNHV